MGTPRQLVWRAVYELLAARVRRPEWGFMNYGYAAAPGGPPLVLDPPDEPDRLCIALYADTLAGVDVAGADVLEVGSGRGGGASFVSRYLGPRTTTGLDFSRAAVDLARRHRTGPGLRFVHGDAQAMPFPDASFDVVLNVESSHCYASMDRFLAEVRRVLRPGGTFALADLRAGADVATLRAQLDASGLEPVRERDITAEVVRALETDNARKLGLIDAWIPRPFHAALRPFAGIEGTRNHVGLTSGALRYVQVQRVKSQVRPDEGVRVAGSGDPT
jgi:SAM-dependent methyltransferase